MAPPNYPVPHTSSEALGAKLVARNPGLIFDRFLGYESWGISSESKKENFSRIINATEQIDTALLAAEQKRWQAMVAAQGGNPFKMKMEWRFITGIGRKGSLEVGFSFNRYGFPFLPGSSVKGLARAYALAELTEMLHQNSISEVMKLIEEPDPQKFETGKAKFSFDDASSQAALILRKIFGTQNEAGCIHFFDAIPDGSAKPKIVVDIMNPHFPKYYQDGNNKTPPADNQNPVPINFLTVEGATFWFGLACEDPQDEQQKYCLQQAHVWLLKGLQDLGAGAKTNAGYGYFTQQDQPVPDNKPEVVAAQETPVVSVVRITKTGKVKNIDTNNRRVFITEENGHSFPVPMQLFGGNTPKAKTAVEVEFENDVAKKVTIKP